MAAPRDEAQSRHSKPKISKPVVAIQDMHNGCIQTGGGATCADRSLLDLFTLTTDLSGIANIIYTGVTSPTASSCTLRSADPASLFGSAGRSLAGAPLSSRDLIFRVPLAC
jgi:hypothetical protein